MNFKWKEMPHTPFNCEKYHKGGIIVGSYSHTLLREDPKGEYIGRVNLPGIAKERLNSLRGTREEVKNMIEQTVRNWFKYLEE